jgi:hypothetical protein
VQTKNKTIIKQDGKQIAEAASEETAEEVAERLNADQHRNEEDRWA